MRSRHPLADAAEICGAAWARGLRPEPRITVSEWADQNRWLPSVAGGIIRWRTVYTPYLREIMDCLSAHHPSKKVVFMGGAQIGKTEAGNNWIGYIIHHAPGPLLLVLGGQEGARTSSKQRLQPMIDACPALRDRVFEATSRSAGNSMFYKQFEGGQLMLTWASSGSGLRGRPTRYVFCDEVDDYPEEVGREGDPLMLAQRGVATFPNHKIYLVSTPTIKGHSRIETEFLKTDRRRYFVPCPECGDMDWLRWERIQMLDKDPATAEMQCFACGCLIPEHKKTGMLDRGEWRPTAESVDGSVGFHLSAFYAPLGMDTTWPSIAAEFLAAQGKPALLKTCLNLKFGETWEERGDEAVEWEVLAARRRQWDGDVPAGVGVLVAAVDVQGAWLEYLVLGFGAGEECWVIAWGQVRGDPALDATWFELDKELSQTFVHSSGRKMGVECVTVDSGGHFTDEVYRFCRARVARKIFAIKGGSELGKPLVGRPSDKNRYRTPLFVLCTDSGKETIFSRFRIAADGPGALHFPAWLDEEFFQQLTAERPMRRYVRGRGSVRSWQKIRERNEAFDLVVYGLAALYILGPSLTKDLARRAHYFAQPPPDAAAAEISSPPPPAPAADRSMRMPRRPGGWLSRIRR